MAGVSKTLDMMIAWNMDAHVMGKLMKARGHINCHDSSDADALIGGYEFLMQNCKDDDSKQLNIENILMMPVIFQTRLEIRYAFWDFHAVPTPPALWLEWSTRFKLIQDHCQPSEVYSRPTTILGWIAPSRQPPTSSLRVQNVHPNR